MATRAAATVTEYLADLPADRRQVAEQVRGVIVDHLPAGYTETMAFGMITWAIPLATYPDTYNGQPLAYASLAAQKNHFALHLNSVYMDPALEQQLREGFAAAGLKLDMGKSCLRFRRLEDVPLDLIGRIIAATPPARHIETYEAARARAAPRRKG